MTLTTYENLYITIKNSCVSKHFLDFIHIPNTDIWTYNQPYGYTWKSNSCSYDSVLAVINNLFFNINNNDELNAYISTFPLTSELNNKMVMPTNMTPNIMKRNWIKNLFYDMFDGSFQTVLEVFEKLVENERIKYNKSILINENKYVLPHFVNIQFTYEWTCSKCSNIMTKIANTHIIIISYNYCNINSNHTLQEHTDYYFNERVKYQGDEVSLAQIRRHKCNNKGCNEKFGAINNISITFLPYMIIIYDFSRRLINDPGISLSKYLTISMLNIPILYEIYAVIYIFNNNHFITKFVHKNDVYIYDGMVNNGIPIRLGYRNDLSLLEKQIEYMGSLECFPIMIFFRKCLTQQFEIAEI